MTASLMSFVSPPQIIVRGHNSNRSVSPSFGENVCIWRGYRWRYSQQCFSAGDRLCGKVTRSQYAGSWRSLHLWDSWAQGPVPSQILTQFSATTGQQPLHEIPDNSVKLLFQTWFLLRWRVSCFQDTSSFNKSGKSLRKEFQRYAK